MRRTFVALVALSLLAAACTIAQRDAATSSTEGATSSTVGPTTTTEAPGLGVQTLSLGLVPERLDKYDATYVVGIQFDASGLGMGPDAVGEVTVTLEGRLWRLFLAGPRDGTFEVLDDLRVESGSIEGRSGSTSFQQDLTEAFLEGDSSILTGYVIDAMALPQTQRGGAPGYRAQGSLSNSVLAFGPPMAPHAVGVGDTWMRSALLPELGDSTIKAEIVAEEEVEDGLAYRIDYTITPSGLPIALSLGEVAAIFEASPVGGLLAGLDDDGDPLFAVISEFEADGSFQLEPTSGRVLSLSSSSRTVVEISGALDGASFEITGTQSSTTTLALVESAEVKSFERAGVLERLAPDPFVLASEPFDGLFAFDVTAIEAGDLDGFAAKANETRQDLFAGFDFGWAAAPGAEPVLVISIKVGGDQRGAPYLGESLAYFWGGDRNPEPVLVGDETAFGANVDGEQWLVWSDTDGLIVLIGPRASAVAVMEAIIAVSSPYVWQMGDCLDFSDEFEQSAPYAPFGAHGLSHCAAAHTHEVIHAETLADEPGAPYPGEIGDRLQAVCSAAYSEYTGSVQDTDNELKLVTYMPDVDEWERGSRYLTCLLSRSGPDGIAPVEGRLRGLGPDFEFEISAGDCFGFGVPVPCTEAHDSQFFVQLDHPAGPDEAYPGFTEFVVTANAACDLALDDFGPTPGPLPVEGRAAEALGSSWEGGERTYWCMALVVDDTTGVAEVVGSFDEEWSLAGA